MGRCHEALEALGPAIIKARRAHTEEGGAARTARRSTDTASAEPDVPSRRRNGGPGDEYCVPKPWRLQAEAAGEYAFDPGQLNDVGDAPGAIAVFEFNVELSPEVGNTWESLGEARLANGERERAIRSYRKALELDPDNDNARATLNRLESAAPQPDTPFPLRTLRPPQAPPHSPAGHERIAP